MARASVLAALLVGLAARTVHAQRLVGTLRHEADSTPVAGALVEVRGPREFRIRTVTSEGGAFVTVLPSPGTYRIAVLRIGHEPWVADSLTITRAGASVRYYVPDRPIVLQEITVDADRSRCGAPPAGTALGQMLTEADKAIALTAASMDAGVIFSAYRWQRRLGPGLVLLDSTGMSSAARGWPIQSAPPESLRVWGFVRNEPDAQGRPTPTYYGPDARVLFADWFLASHCLRFHDVNDHGQPTLAVEFMPEGHGDKVDIAGEFVFDSLSLELRRLQWRWVGLPDWVPRDGPGGYIEFRRLPSGAWLTGAWALRAPIPRVLPGAATRLAGYVEWGGRVTSVH